MGFVKTEERRKAELEELRRKMTGSAGLHRSKDEQQEELEGGLVCVTSGVSYLGVALVNRLLLLGYSVRIIVDNSEDIDKLWEMETLGEMGRRNQNVEAVVAKLDNIQSLYQVFEGCRGVFHTSAFTDPAGLSGYTKTMAEIEVKAAENVMVACARTTSIRKCVFTSSLVACVWGDNAQQDQPSIINEDSWSNESYCTDRTLWYALGKMRAEKAAWRIAKERGLELTTICPALITGPEFCQRNPTPTIAYLKGAQEMYANGMLATVDVMRLAEAQVCVFKAMNGNAFGRYICFDNILDSQSEAEKLAVDIGMPVEKICSNSSSNSSKRLKLSNEKLGRLMSRPLRCTTLC
ncbi:Cinnamoyl-CoA reductase [Quillaja saponaria]|uniref:Cinnamoyl-CoA reductase n=1 Tax=Quillaja saponaria TaxID=32244 RepID=A0AAD7PX74_QUISA|nr:Cinnamoyl-CoA reductase [Quillaja saponaria]